MLPQKIDVALNIFAKPYQTSLSVLSLLKFCDAYIDRIHLQFEPSGSMFDTALPYAIADYLGERAVITQPEHWLKLEAADASRYDDLSYRMSVRYQHAFENTDKKYLFIMHNDVLIKGDVIGKMLGDIGDAFVIGQLGQCWNCPAAHAEVCADCGMGEQGCHPDRYQELQPDFEQLCSLYKAAGKRGIFVRPYLEQLHVNYSDGGWPLPECRVNEWAALVDVERTRPYVIPHGSIAPFGAFEQCGKICLDTSVAWFRGLHRLGLRAKNMDIAPYVTHWIGTGKMTSYKYLKAEANARQILQKHFPDYVKWCLEQDNKMFV
ncbi:hypothetical protein LJC48_04450 [Desulfovibrio sp. OttesenSCG-928-C06]|nr:hypothetical protein [Desulfovibrio sp. OttesenSCG-928-C06]